MNYARPLQTQQNAKTIDSPGKTQPQTEHNKHYRTLLVGFGKVRFTVGITTIATIGLIAAIAIAQYRPTDCYSLPECNKFTGLRVWIARAAVRLMGITEPIFERRCPRVTPLG